MSPTAELEVKNYTCTRCKKDFRSGEWLGCMGNQTWEHKLERRTFYSIEGAGVVSVKPDSVLQVDGNKTLRIPGKVIAFVEGRYHTDDPETQEVLARRCPMTKEAFIDYNSTDAMKAGRLKAVVTEQASALEAAQQENARLAAELAEAKNKGASEDGGADKDQQPSKPKRK